MFTDEEIKRYARPLSVDGFSESDQEALKNSAVLVVGVGALGSIVTAYLAGSGVGTLYLVDFDTIDISNLHRQILYNTDDLGCSKAYKLSERLKRLNPLIMVHAKLSLFTNNDETRELIAKCDLIVECTDNPATKLLVEKMGREQNKPVILGGVSQWSGQVMTSMPGHARFSEIFGDDDRCNVLAPCSTSGVIGPVPGIVASIQAVEAIKLITGTGIPLIDRLLTFNSFEMEFKTWKTR